MQDTTHSMMRSARRFFSGTVLSRFSGLLRDITMAAAFGTQETVATFFVAFRLSHLLRRLFGEGALQSAFVPYFETLRSESAQRAYQFFCDLAFLLTVGLSGLILLLMAGLGGILYSVELLPSTQELLWFTLLLMPGLLFICLYGLNASLLQCEKSYFTAGVAPVAFNLIWVAGVLWLSRLPTIEAISWLTFWVVAACFAQWAITLPRVYCLMREHDWRLLWRGWSVLSTDIKRIGTLLCLGIVGVAATQINSALDALFARYAEPEGPALLWYALRIQQLPLALFGVAISGALLPPLTRALKNEDRIGFQRFQGIALRRTVALMLPMTAAILVIGESCVSLLYGHGDFTQSSVLATTRCLWGYGVGLLPMTLVLVFAPEFYARGMPHIPATASVISMIANVMLNTLFVAYFGWGAVSIALATSLSACLNCLLLGYHSQELRCVLTTPVCLNMAKVCIATLAAMCTVVALEPLLPEMAQITRFLVLASCFSSTLFAVGALLQADDLLHLLKEPRQA